MNTNIFRKDPKQKEKKENTLNKSPHECKYWPVKET
jgi:hypothetical protein